MRWPWRRRRVEVDPAVEIRRMQADAAVDSTRQALDEVRSYWPEVLERSATARRIREENHFADAVRRNLRGRPA